MDAFENIEEIAHQILFGFKHSPTTSGSNSPSKKANQGNHYHHNNKKAPRSPNLFASSQEIDFVPSSPSRTSYLSSFMNGGSSKNKYEVPYQCDSPLSSPSLLPPVPTLGSNKNLIPSPSNSLCNSTDSLGSSTDSFSISSPSQSVPSSPPFGKSSSTLKLQKYLSLKSENVSPSTSYTNLLSPHHLHQTPSSPVKISSPSSSPSPCNNNNNKQLLNIQCTLNECLLCQRGQPDVLVKSPTWASIMRVVFFTLHNEMKEKQFFSLKTDVYDFMTTHWDVLCLHKKRSDNWHKQIQDMLSHSKNIFESGMDKYKQNGFWRLKQTTDPWILPQKGCRKSSSVSSSPVLSLSASSPSILSSSPSSSSASSSPSFYVPSISATTSPLILSSSANSVGASSSSSASINSSPACNIPNIKHKYHQSTSHLFDEGARKRSSIDMLISDSSNINIDEIVSPVNKKRYSESSQFNNEKTNWTYSDDSEELYIDDDN